MQKDITILIHRLFRYKESIEFYANYIKTKGYSDRMFNLSKKAKLSFQETNNILKSNYYFVCIDCKKVFRNKNKLLLHLRISHLKQPFNCFYCDDKFPFELDFKNHEKTHELDLHELYVKDALIKVKVKLKECQTNNKKGIKIIHGYHRGHALRDYFRSQLFIKEMKKVGLYVRIVRTSLEGETSIIFSTSTT